MMKFIMSHKIAAAIIAAVITAGTVTGVVLANKSNTPEEPQNNPVVTQAVENNSGNGNTEVKTVSETDTTVYHEVKFAMPVGLKAGEAEKITLPETLMLADGTTFAELPSAKEDGKMFLGWYYDDGLTYMSASSDVVDHNITLYPRFGTKEGMDGTFSYDYVAKRDVDKNYQVLVVSHNQTTDDVKQEIAVRNLTKGGEDIDFTLEKYNGAVAGLISGDASYEPDEEIRELLKKVSIDPDADTLPDLYELYGLSEEDSPERYWREELRLDPDKVVLLQDAVLHLQQREWDRADIYIVHPVAGAWTEGSLQQVEIKDTASLRFVFEDEETDERIVYHNFTVTKAEYNDVKLSSSMVYIPLNEVEGVDDLGSLLKLVAANDSEDVVQAERSGIMTTAVQLAVGTKVAVYDGTLGEGGTVDGDISYFKITEVLGDNRYAYEGAAILDIIDTPVVIPVKAGNNPASGTITLTAEDLTFDKPIHEVLRLNGSTKVQEGSFIMFYEGQLPTTLAELKSRGTGYGRITGVTPAGNALTVTYEAATVDDMHRSQGMYTKVDQVDIPVTEQEVENIRQGLLNQMEESGYADAVGNYIVALINGDVEMPDDPEIADSLKNIAFKTDTGEDISLEELRPLAAGQKVEFSGLTAGFTIAPKLEHFSGTGIRAVFHAGFTIKIHMNEDNILEIQCVAQIEQEILLGYNLDFEIEWDVIIPVDATIDAALQAGTFTCFSAQATIMTKTDEKETDWARLLETTGAGDNPNKKDAQDLVDLSKQLKTMSKNLEKVQGGGQYSKQKGEAVQHGAASEADTGAGASMGGDLPTKYSQMLENDAEYVPIIKQELFALEFHLDPWHVIAVGFSADFVLSWKLNAMIGFSISYGNAKQFCYHVSVAAGTVEKQVGDLETPNFRIDFFLFGMVGVRAGVEFELRLGLISTKLDSIGISAEIGVYMELYGFLYMYYAWRSGEEPDSGIMGSLLFEIGAYLEINFKAQLGDEALSYEKTLYEKKWPFLTLGAESVPVPHPVNTDEDDEIYEMLEIEKGKNTVKVPDSVFKVYSMALESGELSDESWDSNKVGEKNYSFSINGREYTQYNEEHFTVSCVDLDGEDGRSNGKHSFQYLPATNEIYVKPVDNDKDEYWGEITFIYTNDSFGFTTVEIKRTLKVHWKGEAMTAVVEYYLQNEDRTGYDLVKYGGFDGFDGIEYDLIVNEDFIFQFPGYYLVGVNYPGTKDMDAKEKEVYAELQDVQEKYRRKEVNSKVLAAANEKWNQFYDRYQNYYENILNTMKTYKGVLYFLMVKNETVVKLYFDRQPDHTINPYIVYNKPMTGGRYFTLGSMEIRGGENFLERLVEASEWFRKTYHYELEWYYVPKSGLESYPRTTIVDDQGRTGFTYQKNAISEDGTVKYYLPTFRTAYFDEVKDLLSNASGWKPVTENTTMPDEGIIVIGYTYAKTPAKVIWTSENGETVYREDVCQYMDHVLDPPDITGTLPAKKGYSYKIDWYNDYNQAINSFGYVLTEELVYSARVSLNPTYQKIYLEIDGEREYYTSQRTDEVVKLSRLKDKEGYTMKVIAVWDDGEIEITKDSVIHMPSSDLTLKITYTINSYNVQWVDGGNVIKEETLEFGSALTPPEVSVNTAGNEALIWQIDGKKLSNPATVPGRDVVITADRHIHDYVDTIIRKSSCSQQGKVRHTCSICGEIKDEALPLDPESHQWLAGEIIPATCVDPSGRDYWCSRCGQHRTEYDDESTKNPGNHVGPSRIVDGYPETCTEDGLADAYYCEACGELMHGGTKIPAKGHYWSEAIYAWAANNMTVTATH
ncbi:MAG: hypothetical protein J6Y89_02745, partial [Lachnospiraceae bacterium]|nr:hypothetical protein [Lachnospiraceae bacterium]